MALSSWIRRNKATTFVVVMAPFCLTLARASSFAMAAAASMGVAPGQAVDVPSNEIDVPAAVAPQRDVAQEALKAYAQGDVDLAAELAKNGGDEALAAQFSEVQAHAAASGVSRVAGDLDGAIRELEAAAQLDEKLAPQGSIFGKRLKEKLADLYVTRGQKSLTEKKSRSALSDFLAATKFDESNPVARRQIRKLQRGH